MKVLLTGASGQLARAVMETWQGHEIIAPDENRFDLRSHDAIRSVVEEIRPQVLLNLGAFTQVDRCETEPELAMLVNGTAVEWLAKACNGCGATLVQVSTDYVFSGCSKQPYLEIDPTSPLSIYGQSKLQGELGAATCARHLVARTSWLYDAWGRNFYRSMLASAARRQALRVVDDQKGAPTSCRALARQLAIAVEESWHGLVHMTCQGETTWYGFAKEIFRLKGIEVDLTPCASDEYPTLARRPAYSVLSGEGRRARGRDVMPPWQEALEEVIATDAGTTYSQG